MLIFDGHNDTLTRFYAEGHGSPAAFFEESHEGHIDLPRARRGGLAGGLFAIMTPPMPDSPERQPMYGLTFTENGYDVSPRSPVEQPYAQSFTDAVIDFAVQLQAESHGAVRIVTTASELERRFTGDTDSLALVLHIEGAEAIHPDGSNLDSYFRRGIRSLGLVWSRPNAFGEGVPFRFPASPDTGPGLTEAGKALVTACDRLGVLVDLAHLNEKGFWDAARLSSAPLVVTHADVHAICPSTRNLTDAQIDAIAASGGLIGINFETLNTHPQASIDQSVPLAQITAHIDYIANRVGVDHIAFGSDFDGAMMPHALHDAAGLPNLIAALRERGYDQPALEKIAFRNWLRVFKSTWKE